MTKYIIFQTLINLKDKGLCRKQIDDEQYYSFCSLEPGVETDFRIHLLGSKISEENAFSLESEKSQTLVLD